MWCSKHNERDREGERKRERDKSICGERTCTHSPAQPDTSCDKMSAYDSSQVLQPVIEIHSNAKKNYKKKERFQFNSNRHPKRNSSKQTKQTTIQLIQTQKNSKNQFRKFKQKLQKKAENPFFANFCVFV